MYKLLYPSIRVRTAPPVSVMVRIRVSVCFSLHNAHTVLHVWIFAIADLNPLHTDFLRWLNVLCILVTV